MRISLEVSARAVIVELVAGYLETIGSPSALLSYIIAGIDRFETLNPTMPEDVALALKLRDKLTALRKECREEEDKL